MQVVVYAPTSISFSLSLSLPLSVSTLVCPSASALSVCFAAAASVFDPEAHIWAAFYALLCIQTHKHTHTHMLSGVCVCMVNFWGQRTVPIRIRTCLSACSNQYTQVVLYSIHCELSIRTRRTYVAHLRIPRFLFAPAAVYLFKFNASSPQFAPPFHLPQPQLSVAMLRLLSISIFATTKSEFILWASAQNYATNFYTHFVCFLLFYFLWAFCRRGVALFFFYY